MAPIYRAHRAVIFAVAQLSCYLFVFEHYRYAYSLYFLMVILFPVHARGRVQSVETLRPIFAVLSRLNLVHGHHSSNVTLAIE